MTYKLRSDINKISSPVTILFDGMEFEYKDGRTAVDELVLEKNALVDNVYCRDNRIVIVLKENDMINNTNWCGEEQISFF